MNSKAVYRNIVPAADLQYGDWVLAESPHRPGKAGDTVQGKVIGDTAGSVDTLIFLKAGDNIEGIPDYWTFVLLN